MNQAWAKAFVRGAQSVRRDDGDIYTTRYQELAAMERDSENGKDINPLPTLYPLVGKAN